MSQSIEDYTWKDIPWADPSRSELLRINEGTNAVIPELNESGTKTGEFVVLGHDDYTRIMGSLAYVKEQSDGDPRRYLKKGLPDRSPEPNPVVQHKATLPAGGMEK